MNTFLRNSALLKYALILAFVLNFRFVCAQTFLNDETGLYFSVISDRHNEVEVTKSQSSANMVQYPLLEGEVKIPSSVEYEGVTYKVTAIGDRSFFGNKKITSIKVPEYVERFGKYSMSGCSALESINFPSSLTVIDAHALSSSAIMDVELPSQVFELGNGCFNEIPTLISFRWDPAAESVLPMNALSYCGQLQSIELGENVTYYDYYSLGNLASLNSMTIMATVPPRLDPDAINGDLKDVVLTVPKGSLDFYKSAEVWKNLRFGDYKEVVTSIAVESILLDCSKTQLKPGESVIINATVLPANADNHSILWSSSDNSVVDVDQSGRVTARGEGSAIIKAKSVSNSSVCGLITFDVKKDDPVEEFVSLQIKTYKAGSVGLRLKKGERALIEILPEDGYEVESVTMDGEDVTDMLKGFMLTTNPINKPTVLRVVLKKAGSAVAVNPIEMNKFRVIPGDGILKISGLADSEFVEVYKMDGALLKRISEDCEIIVDKGVYIIRRTNSNGLSDVYKTII